jgi:phosphate starvation-inducible protein PhoH and related proteins
MPQQRSPLKANQTLPTQDRFQLHFEDNQLLAALLGEFDSHLVMLEDKLGIEAVAHGNVVMLDGPTGACEVARDVLVGLYSRLEAGGQVSAGDVDGALRHARAGRRAKEAAQAPANTGSRQTDRPGEIATRKRLITARTPAQSSYIRALQTCDLVFGTGPAGTGKTYLAVAHAAALLERGETERLILSRPAVEAGERLGFLPGDMREKVDPYLRPLYDALYDVLPPERVQRGMETNVIEIAPLAFMRGRTLSHSVVILDEAQNTTTMQMKMFLTRLGEGSKMIVTGDPSQIDLPPGQTSGLAEATSVLDGVKGIDHIAFSSQDVVRSELAARIVEAYNKVR